MAEFLSYEQIIRLARRAEAGRGDALAEFTALAIQARFAEPLDGWAALARTARTSRGMGVLTALWDAQPGSGE